MCGSRGGQGVWTSPRKLLKYRFLAILVPIPLKSQSYQARFQFWAIIDTQAKRHLNGISLADQRGPTNNGI